MTLTEKQTNDINMLVKTATELVNRVEHPERIPDTCYRGDVSRWNFGYFLSRRERSARECAGGGMLSSVIGEIFGGESEELTNYNRAVQLCRNYSVMYDLEVKDI